MHRAAAPLALALVVLLLTGCEDREPNTRPSIVDDPADVGTDADDGDTDGDGDAADAQLDADVSPDGTGDTPDDSGAGCTQNLMVPRLITQTTGHTFPVSASEPCALSFETPSRGLVEVRVWPPEEEWTLDGERADALGWFPPSITSAGLHTLELSPPGRDLDARVELRYAPSPLTAAEDIDQTRSLAWTDAALLDDAEVISLSKVLEGALGAETNQGTFVSRWFDAFSTSAHSERLGPLLMLEEFGATHGDPATWDVNELPFVVTGVHNRIDLGDGAHCGEFRVSFASIHPIFQPFHVIFLFRQPPLGQDVGPDGVAHCAWSALRWASLGELDEGDFKARARELLESLLVPEGFLLAESVEFTVSPWEWRQWRPVDDLATELPFVFDNPPLFQTVDIERLNRQGAAREDFLDWVAANADALDSRRIELPERFRPLSARANAGVPNPALDLDGVDPQLLARLPNLGANIALMGCPACHFADAEFVQTLPDRTFSPFYTKELDARAAHLLDLVGHEADPAPFGPLQPNPTLP